MYVCVCNAIRESQVTAALNEGLLSVRELRRHFAFREGCCGKCHRGMREMIDAHCQGGRGECGGNGDCGKPCAPDAREH